MPCKPKTVLLLQLTFLWMCGSFNLFAQPIALKNGWYFRNADSLVFSKADYPFQHWASVYPGKSWQEFPGFEQTKGSNWYRINVKIPVSLKDKSVDGIILNLMRINGADETWFNGELIGKTGIVRQYNVLDILEKRKYLIPSRLIQFDQENTISIRVTDFSNRSGLTNGNLTLSLPESDVETSEFVKLGKPTYNGSDRFILSSRISTETVNLIRNNKGAWLNLGNLKGWKRVLLNGVEVEGIGRNPDKMRFRIPETALKENGFHLEVLMKDENVGSLLRPDCYLEPFISTEWLSIWGNTKLVEGEFITDGILRNQGSEPIAGELGIFYTSDMFRILEESHQFITVKGNSDINIQFSTHKKFSGAVKVNLRFRASKTGFIVDHVTFSEFVKDNRFNIPDDPDSGQPGSDISSVSFLIPFKIANRINEQFTPFRYQQQKLAGNLGFLFHNNLEKRLLKVDTAEIMSGYKRRPGKQTYIGEHAGKYIQASTNTWLVTGNKQLKHSLDNVVRQLISTQLSDGYLGTYIPEKYWTEWDVWSHKYNLIGLLTYYRATGYEPALTTCRKMGNLLCNVFGDQTGQKKLHESGHHFGMASGSVLEPMVDLYRITGESRYLEFCNYILRDFESEGSNKLISSLLKNGNVEKTANAKAYEMLSCMVGVLRMYQQNSDPLLLKSCMLAWQDIRTKRMYISGTASSGEHFQDNYYFPFQNEDHMGEGCVTTTWIQFSLDLFRITGDTRFMDEIERSVFNHLPAAENPQTGCVSYYTALEGKKPHSCTLGSSCCLSSVPRGISYLPQLIWGNYKSGIGIFQYTEGSVNESVILRSGKKVPFQLKIKTNYPESGKVSIEPGVLFGGYFPIFLRVPAWTNSFIATIDGGVYKGIPGKLLTIERYWKSQDRIDVQMDMSLQIIPGHGEFANLVALQVGPQVLALDSSLCGSLQNKDWKIPFPVTPAFNLKAYKGKFPDHWIGNQAWTLSPGLKESPLIFTPFSTSGQMGAPIKVWIGPKR